jgi:hypothetical protein
MECNVPLADSGIFGVVSRNDTGDSETGTLTTFQSFDSDPARPNDGKMTQFFPLNNPSGQDLIQTPLQQELHNAVRFNLPSPEYIYRDTPNQDEEDGVVDTTPHQTLYDLSPKDMAITHEVPDDKSDDDMSFSSSASSHAEYNVMFSSTTDMFLRTLAMERMLALSMSEWSIRTESSQDTTTGISQLRFFPRLTLNDRLGLLILGLLFLHCSGTVYGIIATFEQATRQIWIAFFHLLFLSATTTTTPTDQFYNILNEPMGVWLA